MNTGITITVSVIFGLALLFVIMGFIYSRIGKRLQKLIANRFDKEEMLGATTRANFFGIKSKGGAQIRGNGALVLTKKGLYFFRAAPQKEYKIPMRSIQSVSMPKFFNGKTAFVPLLCIRYNTHYGEDSIAWALKDAKKWKDTIENMIS